MTAPDKPLSSTLKPLRNVIRTLRKLGVTVRNVGKVTYGNNVTFGARSEVYVPNYLVIGSNVSFGSNLIVQVNLTVGDGVLVSSKVSFIGHDHDVLGADIAYFSGRLRPANVILEEGCFIGFGATILGDVRIGRRSIVGAHALVTRDVPDNAIVTGIPARVTKLRD